MMWAPLEKFSEIEDAQRRGVPVYWWPQKYSPDYQEDVALQIGRRYKIELDHMRGEFEVVGINHGAESPLHMMWLSKCGSTLLGWFSPDQFLEVTPV